MEITNDILKKAAEMSNQQLMDYQNYINRAFQENDEILDVNLKLRLSMNKEKFKIQTDISFTAEKTKDTQTYWYDLNQMQLFGEEEQPDA